MLNKYTRGVFWGEIDRGADLPADPVQAWKDVVKLRPELPTHPDGEFLRGYADGHAGLAVYPVVAEPDAEGEG